VSGAALALAVALAMIPAASQRRLEALGLVASARRRLPVLPCAVAVAVALTVALPVSAVAASSMVGVTLWIRRMRHGRARRRATESAALQGALDVLVGELRVGAHPVAAFSVAATEVDGTVAAAFRAVAARARLGADVAAGLHSVARTSSLPAHWERLAACWRLAQNHGLAIATLMQTAQRDIVERDRFSARVDAGMTGARTTAAILAGLPLLGVGLGQLIGAEPVSFLLSGGLGGWLLVIGVALACGGLLWSDHITSRVLT
jgi:tight adherence protein B